MNTSWLILSVGTLLLGRPTGIALISGGFTVNWHPEQMHAGFGHLHLFHLRCDLPIPHEPRSLVKHPAPIKCLPLELFSSHVILLLDCNPCLPPRSCILSQSVHTGGQHFYSSCTGSIACNVFCHLSYATAWLTQLRLIKSLLASVVNCPVQLFNPLSLVRAVHKNHAACSPLWPMGSPIYSKREITAYFTLN